MRTLLLVCLVAASLPGQSAQDPPKSLPAPKAEKSQVSEQNGDSESLSKARHDAGSPGIAPQPQLDGSDRNSKADKHDAKGDNSLYPDWWMIALTAGLVLVGVGQVWVLIRQAGILSQQAKYMQSALRPRLSIRNVEIESVESLLLGESEETVGTFQIYSSGGSNAHVWRVTCRLFAFAKLPMKVMYEPQDQLSCDIKLPPGVYGTQCFRFLPVDFARFKAIRQKAIGLYILGELFYSDDLGINRTTRFCRLFDWEKERFLPAADPDYESAG